MFLRYLKVFCELFLGVWGICEYVHLFAGKKNIKIWFKLKPCETITAHSKVTPVFVQIHWAC